jgi:hypothetical protein
MIEMGKRVGGEGGEGDPLGEALMLLLAGGDGSPDQQPLKR